MYVCYWQKPSKRVTADQSSFAFSALRSFLDWQVAQGMLDVNSAKGIRTPKSGRHLPKNMDVDEVNQLMNIDLNDPFCQR